MWSRLDPITVFRRCQAARLVGNRAPWLTELWVCPTRVERMSRTPTTQIDNVNCVSVRFPNHVFHSSSQLGTVVHDHRSRSTSNELATLVSVRPSNHSRKLVESAKLNLCQSRCCWTLTATGKIDWPNNCAGDTHSGLFWHLPGDDTHSTQMS